MPIMRLRCRLNISAAGDLDFPEKWHYLRDLKRRWLTAPPRVAPSALTRDWWRLVFVGRGLKDIIRKIEASAVMTRLLFRPRLESLGNLLGTRSSTFAAQYSL